MPSHYLVNNAWVLLDQPLVSASDARFEGQIRAYRYKGRPCPHCIFPQPPLAEAVTNSLDGRVLSV